MQNSDSINSLPVNFNALGEFLQTLQEAQNHLKAQEIKIIDLDYKNYYRPLSNTLLEMFSFEVEFNQERYSEDNQKVFTLIANEIEGLHLYLSHIHFRSQGGSCNVLFTRSTPQPNI